jgi:hypothetical protein
VFVQLVDDDDVPAVSIEGSSLARYGPEERIGDRHRQRRHAAIDHARQHRTGLDHLARIVVADVRLLAGRGTDEHLCARLVVAHEPEEGDPRAHRRLAASLAGLEIRGAESTRAVRTDPAEERPDHEDLPRLERERLARVDTFGQAQRREEPHDAVDRRP